MIAFVAHEFPAALERASINSVPESALAAEAAP